jgi:hypothetical protein
MSKAKPEKKACPTCNEFRHELCCKRCGVLCSYVGSFAPFCGVRCEKRFALKAAEIAGIAQAEVVETAPTLEDRLTVDED